MPQGSSGPVQLGMKVSWPWTGIACPVLRKNRYVDMDGESLGSMFSPVVIFGCLLGSLLGSCLAWPCCSGSMDVIPGIQFRQSAADPRCVPAACVSVNQSERRGRGRESGRGGLINLARMADHGKSTGQSKRLISVEEDGRRKMGNHKDNQTLEVDLITFSTCLTCLESSFQGCCNYGYCNQGIVLLRH